jgi:hypothetical protein
MWNLIATAAPLPFHRCRSEMGGDRAPPDAWSSSRASVRRLNSATFASTGEGGVRRWCARCPPQCPDVWKGAVQVPCAAEAPGSWPQDRATDYWGPPELEPDSNRRPLPRRGSGRRHGSPQERIDAQHSSGIPVMPRGPRGRGVSARGSDCAGPASTLCRTTRGRRAAAQRPLSRESVRGPRRLAGSLGCGSLDARRRCAPLAGGLAGPPRPPPGERGQGRHEDRGDDE